MDSTKLGEYGISTYTLAASIWDTHNKRYTSVCTTGMDS